MMTKSNVFTLGTPGKCSHKLLISPGTFDDFTEPGVDVIYGEDGEAIRVFSSDTHEHSFKAYARFQDKHQTTFKFNTTLLACGIVVGSKFKMLCLQIACKRHDKFLWLPDTPSNNKRLKNLIKDFSDLAFSAYDVSGYDFSLQALVDIATNEMPHLEICDFREMPEELDSFESEPDLIKDVKDSLQGSGLFIESSPKPRLSQQEIDKFLEDDAEVIFAKIAAEKQAKKQKQQQKKQQQAQQHAVERSPYSLTPEQQKVRQKALEEIGKKMRENNSLL